MKAAVHTGKKRLEIQEVPMPRPGPGEYLVKIKACAVCGSDVWWLDAPVADEPVHGHESAGVIVEAGKGTARFKAGDRVVCYAIKGCGQCASCRQGEPTHCATKQFIQNGFQEYAVFSEELLFPCPDVYDFVAASLLSDAIGVPLRGLRRLPPEKTDTVAVWGLGPLGLAMVLFLKAKGVARVIGVDTQPFRLEKALEFGAMATVNPAQADAIEEIKRLSGGSGCDKAYILARPPKATADAFFSTREGAALCTLVGIEGHYALQEWVERTLVWSFYFTPGEYAGNIAFLREHAVDVSRIVSDVFPLDRAQEAFVQRFDHQDRTLKTVIVME
jgi:threonine dehydrogenase-like Zn-dependent dehydrogenase